jgi:hypothetical protein
VGVLSYEGLTIANAIAQEETKEQTARNVAKAVTSIKKPETSQDTQSAQEISPWDTSPQALITTLKGNQGRVVFSHHPDRAIPSISLKRPYKPQNSFFPTSPTV